MGWASFGTRLDSKVGELAERTTRAVTRRQAVRTVLVGGATGIASLAVGVDPALASCAGNCGPTRRCSNCRPHRCPSGYVLCKGSSTSNCFNYQGYRCEWPAGHWTACTGLGRGYGYKICQDCIGPGGCRYWCTCLTECKCCNCTTQAEVVAEQHRVQELMHAGG